jgi:kynureninase
MNFQNSLEFARQLDEQDELKHFREMFYIPIMLGKECIYFTGNSLGLQAKRTQDYVVDELEDWASLGVGGHLHARNPWLPYHEIFPRQLSKIVGCKENEVVVMNSLTVNLHLLLVSFYRPTRQRNKIICEAKAFPSDQYAFEAQAKYHACLPDRQGFNPSDAVIEISPREGEHTLRTEDIVSAIKKHGDSVAVVLFGGVNYYTGQLFDMKAITEAAHSVGAYAGFDLAHAAGNVELHLHKWDVDFACWCSYKYLNSGPGGVAGVYIHERHAANTELPRFAGWWGYTKETRFKMEKGFEAIPTAEGWQLSNAPVLSMAAHKAALDVFEEAGIDKLHKKSRLMSGYLHYILNELISSQTEKIIEVITPPDENERGCQISMLMLKDGKGVFNELTKNGVIADWREPNVIRVAPVPLYNSFEDIFRFGEIMKTTIEKI